VGACDGELDAGTNLKSVTETSFQLLLQAVINYSAALLGCLKIWSAARLVRSMPAIALRSRLKY